MSEYLGPQTPDEPTIPVGDDLPPDLVAALRAPGSEEELADEAFYVGAFRQHHQTVVAPVIPAQRGVRRLNVRRLGTGGTAVVVAVALTGGVAAAYTGNLPDPVQHFAHVVIGAPAPSTDRPPVKAVDTTTDPSPSTTSAGTSASASPSSEPSAGQDGGHSPGSGSSGGTGPSSSPSPTTGGDSQGSEPSQDPGPSTEPSTSPTPAADPPAAASMSGTDHLVGYGATISLTGHLTTASGAPAAGRRIVLMLRDSAGWSPIAKLTTDASGDVAAASRPVTGLQHYRWRAKHGVKSGAWKVRVKPTLSATADVGDPSTTITAATVGAASGDIVELYARVGGRLVNVGQAQVSAGGVATFQFPTPKKPRVFGVRLVSTKDHASARDKVKVTPVSPKPVPGTEGQSPKRAVNAAR